MGNLEYVRSKFGKNKVAGIKDDKKKSLKEYSKTDKVKNVIRKTKEEMAEQLWGESWKT